MGKGLHKIYVGIVVLMAALLVLSAGASCGGEAELFEEAYGNYLSYRAERAAELFRRFLTDFPQSSARDAAVFWLAKSLARGGRERDAAKYFSEVTEKFPGSPFVKFALSEIEALGRAAAGGTETGGRPKEASAVEDEKRIYEQTIKRFEEKNRELEKRYFDLKAAFESKLIEESALSESLKVIREEYTRLRAEKSVAVPSLSVPDAADGKRLRDDLARLRSEAEASRKRIGELTAEIEVLREHAKRGETPAPGTGGSSSPADLIMEEMAVSATVLSRMGIVTVPWRNGDPKRDFALEQILFEKAKADGMTPDRSLVEATAKKHSFSPAEGRYLEKYLLISAFVESKRKGRTVSEEDLRAYYDSHRADFLTGDGGKIATYLVFPYSQADEAETAALASRAQRDAISGKSFENIGRSLQGRVELKQSRVEALPAWIRERAEELKEDEICKISSEDEYVLLQVRISEPAYREYGEIREELRGRLTKGVSDLGGWFEELLKEAEKPR